MDEQTKEEKRLGELYERLGDGELLRMTADPESLTPAAQTALAHELAHRGLKAPAVEKLDDGSAVLPPATPADARADGFGVGVPGIVPAAGAAVEQALEPGGETTLGMTSLFSFHDGTQFALACEALEKAGVRPAVQEIDGDATTGTPSRFEVWVDVKDVERGEAALQAALGLFPLREGNELSDTDAVGEASGGIVGQYDTEAEAEQARLILVHGGFAARVERSDESDGEPFFFQLIVPPVEYPAAYALLARQLQLE